MRNVLLIGKPNSGKSLLFQKLSGFYQKVSNFPGVTVEIKRGQSHGVTWVDFPGAYSLNPMTQDEQVAIKQLKLELDKKNDKVILCVLDAVQLERSLVIALQAKKVAAETQTPMVLVVNMIDELQSVGEKVNFDGLASELGVPVFGVSAKTGEGVEELKEVIRSNSLEKVSTFSEDFDEVSEAKRLSKKFGLKGKVLIKKQHKLDKVLLSSIFGGIVFCFIMLMLFQSIFTWASPLMDATESLIAFLSELFTKNLADGALKDFLNDAIFGGFGSFVVFVPQIAILTFIIGLLEDSGYLARASVIAHLPFKAFGLSGKSFVPYLSGHACAIPAIMAARTIESPRKRLLTMITVPFTSCSARLPVYSLLILAFIPATQLFGSFITYQGLAFFALYFLGIITALIVSAILDKSLKEKVGDKPFIIELPRYRMPSFIPLLKRSLRAAWVFLYKAGPIIFIVNLVIWFLGYFPQNDLGLAGSYLASIGKFISPIFEPLGIDWRYGVAILVSFLAREVFVGTLGTMFGIEGADENISSLADNIRADGLGLASGIGLLVFYALAMQCVSTLAVLRSETGSRKIPVLVFIGYTIIAYLGALITYKLLS